MAEEQLSEIKLASKITSQLKTYSSFIDFIKRHQGHPSAIHIFRIVLRLKAHFYPMIRRERVARGYQALSCGRKSIDVDYMSIPKWDVV